MDMCLGVHVIGSTYARHTVSGYLVMMKVVVMMRIVTVVISNHAE